MVANSSSPILFVPSDADVAGLSVGDLALDSFGKMAEVVEIFARGEDASGRAFVCFYTKMSETSRCSHSYKVGELVRTAAACFAYTSAQLDQIEKFNRPSSARPPLAEILKGEVL